MVELGLLDQATNRAHYVIAQSCEVDERFATTKAQTQIIMTRRFERFKVLSSARLLGI